MFENKNILIMGLGITGRSALACLTHFPCKIYVYDEKMKDLKELEEDFILFKEEDLGRMALIVKSPGIYPDHPLLQKARKKGIEIISDLELAYRVTKCKNLIAITGTNGKTTTTTIVGKILASQNKTYVVGNIGKGILDIALEAREEDYIVIEASSFQLEDTVDFCPTIALITYVTKDHLDWHKTVEEYRQAKYKIFANQGEENYLILNGEDPVLSRIEDIKSKIYYFGMKDQGHKGCFIEEDSIYFRDAANQKIEVLPLNLIKIPGKHNVKNIMAAVDIAMILKIEPKKIRRVIENFYGVEHRIEFIGEDHQVKYYNDSKATNPDSTLVAVQAMDQPTVLIAGGYDKGSDFDELLRRCRNRISSLILFGETAELLSREAKRYHYDIYIVEDLKKAVLVANQVVCRPGNILLSPACASWDMYSSYEERGQHFKDLVKELIS